MSVMAITTDGDLERRVVSHLLQKHHPSLRLVEVTATNGTVVLHGKLNSFYEKQLCLNTCQRVSGVVKVVDEMEVARKLTRPQPTSSAAAD